MKKILTILAFLCCTTAFISAQDASATSQIEQTENITKSILKVKGATCTTDLGMIVANVKKLSGVTECEVLKHGAVTTLEVSYSTKETDLEKIQNAVLTTGTCENPNERRYQVKI